MTKKVVKNKDKHWQVPTFNKAATVGETLAAQLINALMGLYKNATPEEKARLERLDGDKDDRI